MAKRIKVLCPNCMKPAYREDGPDGSVIICEAEGVEYELTAKGPARLKSGGRIDALEERLARLEGTGRETPTGPESTETDPGPEGDDDQAGINIGFDDSED